MNWTKITYVGRDAPIAYQSFQAAFTQVWIPVSDDDTIAIYAAEVDASPITVYLSPNATELVRRTMPELALEPSDRPPVNTWKSVGSFRASDPAWCDLSNQERVFYREEHDTTWLDAEEAFGTAQYDFEVLGTFPSAA